MTGEKEELRENLCAAGCDEPLIDQLLCCWQEGDRRTAEQLLSESGFTQRRVRIQGTSARIELLPSEFELLLSMREKIAEKLKEYGFSYVSLDLQGYRMGSMNDILNKNKEE